MTPPEYAFPCVIPWEPGATGVRYVRGMTLREYFAAAALQGLVASEYDQVPVLDQKNPLPEQLAWSAWKAAAAYRLADAMLKEREK